MQRGQKYACQWRCGERGRILQRDMSCSLPEQHSCNGKFFNWYSGGNAFAPQALQAEGSRTSRGKRKFIDAFLTAQAQQCPLS
jgi:hypothetical protein